MSTKTRDPGPGEIARFAEALDHELGEKDIREMQGLWNRYLASEPEIGFLVQAVREWFPHQPFPEEFNFFLYAVHRYSLGETQSSKGRFRRVEVRRAVAEAEGLTSRSRRSSKRAAAPQPPSKMETTHLRHFEPIAGRFLDGLEEEGHTPVELTGALRTLFRAVLILYAGRLAGGESL